MTDNRFTREEYIAHNINKKVYTAKRSRLASFLKRRGLMPFAQYADPTNVYHDWYDYKISLDLLNALYDYFFLDQR